MRSFEDWWNTVPIELQQKTRKGDERNKPLLNQVNYALLHLHLAGKHDAKGMSRVLNCSIILIL